MTVVEPNGGQVTGLRFMLRALRHRNYRLFFSGQGVSLIGTWMQGTSLGWLIRQMTGNDALFWLGFIPAVGQLPTFILPPLVSGVLADRLDRRKILLVTQSLALVQALILATLTYLGVLNITQILLLSLMMGFISAFDIPTRQSFTSDMVEDRADLGNAIALNSSLVNSARVLGPAVGGLLLGSIGAAACFFLNALSYIAVIGALRAIRISRRQVPPASKDLLHNLKEGFLYAAGFRPIRAALLLIATVAFMGQSYGALMPAVATDVLHVGPEKFGTLYGVGAGALIGVVFLASRKTVHGMKKIIATGACIFGIGLIGFSLSREYWLSLALLVVVGIGFITTLSASNTFIQTIVDDDKRGRVMSFWTMCFAGTVPLGSFYTGMMARGIGPMPTIMIGGMACILAGLIFFTRLPMLRRLTHPIYIRKGLIPQVTLAGASMPPETPDEEIRLPAATVGATDGAISNGPEGVRDPTCLAEKPPHE